MARRSGLLIGSIGLAVLGSLVGCSASSGVATVSPGGFATTRFVVPLAVTPPSWGIGPPTHELANFMTWVSPDDAHAVRFLVPLTVYQPGSATAVAPPPPERYLAYLQGLSSVGARVSDVHTTPVGGQSATVLTATATESLDGSLGCQEAGLAAPDCFGLQPDLVLRMAVMAVGGHTLLIWERIAVSAAVDVQQADAAAFDRMLGTVALR